MQIIKISIIVFLALIAASGTFPFGWRFANTIAAHPAYWHLALAILFAGVATLGNAALGSYSLLNVLKTKMQPSILILSTISAIQTGFMGFIGYQKILPLTANIGISLAIMLVNAAINYTALKNATVDFSDYLAQRGEQKKLNNAGGKSLQLLALIIGIGVSLFLALASVDRLVSILSHWQIKSELANLVSYFLAFIIWVPYAALFGNSTRKVAVSAYHFFENFSKEIKQLNKSTIAVFLFAALSGGAFAQMIIEFTDLDRNIPEFLKTAAMQTIIHGIIVPLAFIATVAVNLIALQSLYAAKKKAKD